MARDSPAQAARASRAPARSAPGVTTPRTTGLSARPTARSRRASIQSLDHPTDSWPASTAAVTSAVVAAPAPIPRDRAHARAVTSAAGAACAAVTKPRRVAADDGLDRCGAGVAGGCGMGGR
ncbi:hypothetical protein BJF88_13800 [Cellulosimicrobium sp. CUA-896]|nr:hypothetical protein BJF88_13800 [Cellulosimicrobium sp. CUA-896]